MRKNFGSKSWIYPEPVLIIGTYDQQGRANAMNAAWGGISDTNEIGICISKEHKTTKNILTKKCFTVSCGTKNTYIQCDYVGMLSSNTQEDKIERCGLHEMKAEHVDAPLFKEFPFTLECELICYDENTGHLYGKIVNVSVDERIMSEDKIDINKLQPIIYDCSNHTYNVVGEVIGYAYKDYKKIENER